jgi:hypothetical protein
MLGLATRSSEPLLRVAHAGTLIEADRHLPPRLRVRRHIVVAKPVEPAGVELCVDHLEHGDAGL